MKQVTLCLLVLLLAACKSGDGSPKGNSEPPVITVTIEPLRFFTEAIAGDKFTVRSMVPKGSSPETYDPTPQQLVELSSGEAYLRIGHIGFEQVWMDKLTDNAPHLQVYDASQGIDLIFAPHHHHPPHGESPSPHGVHPHHHGEECDHTHPAAPHDFPPGMMPDPHIWNSGKNAAIMARNILKALCAIDKANEAYYISRHDSLQIRIERTDSLVRSILASPGADHAFMIYHPALSYFARDYGLAQIPIEEGGKEPSPVHLKHLIDLCREEQVRVIFIQPEFDRRNAEAIARQTGTQVVPVNPLAYDWDEEMVRTARHLVGDTAASTTTQQPQRP